MFAPPGRDALRDGMTFISTRGGASAIAAVAVNARLTATDAAVVREN
jgi:hypothetical protein